MLKRSLNFKAIIFPAYFVFFALYFFIGLQPADAVNNYEISAQINIPSINLSSDVAILHAENKSLKTPDELIGSYSINESKTLLIGHSSTVFKNLENVTIGDEITYDNSIYRIINIETINKESVSMKKILSSADIKTIVLMTCAGETLENNDATQRLIITATINS